MEILRKMFTTPGEARLRSGWRLLGQFLLMLILSPVIAGLSFGLAALTPMLAFLADGFMLNNVVFTVSVLVARRWLDRRSFRSLGLEWNLAAGREVLMGILIAAVTMAFIFLVEWIFGWLELKGTAEINKANLMGLAYWGFIFLLVGWGEELLSRGYILQNLAEGVGLKWAIFISSAIFSFLHVLNPSASWASIVGILGAGYFLAYGYVRTKQLWLPIGLHIGWNFFEGPVFGFPVSGLKTAKLLAHEVTGPVLFTGGAFGPEAGLIVLPAMAFGAILIRFYTRNRTSPQGAKA